jgi:hypothetical protein
MDTTAVSDPVVTEEAAIARMLRTILMHIHGNETINNLFTSKNGIMTPFNDDVQKSGKDPESKFRS